MSFQGPGDGDGERGANVGCWEQDCNCTLGISLPASLRKKKQGAQMSRYTAL